jgi:DNA polymerase-3 subunit alpha
MTDFVSLHNQSHFSILDALPSPKDLLLKAKGLNQPALAITDHGSLASAWDAYKAYKEVGVKLIIGCEMYFVNDLHHKNEEKFKHIVLIAKNAEGYRNILTLNKKGYDNGAIFAKKVYPIIDWKLIEKYSEGVICLTACGNGIISQLLMQKKFQEAEDALLKLKKIFNEDLGIEVQPNNLKRNANPYSEEIDQKFINHQLINLGKKLNIKIVPACNSHYLNKEDAETHDVLLAIGSHQPVYSNFRIRYSVPDFYLKSGDEVKSFFSRNYGEEFAEQICQNTIYFANKCENPEWIDPKYSNPSGKELPVFPVKDEPDYDQFLSWLGLQDDLIKQLDEDKQYLRYRCLSEMTARIPEEKKSIYMDRLNEELDVIEYHGFSSYMLIVADFLNWARKNGISTGEGRGSAGGSLIAYLIGIHQADPIQYKLIFARFHNKEKKSFPDIDSDIAPSGREKLQEYVRKKYGEDRVAHVSNVNTVTPKVYARDISRSCELGGSREVAVKLGNDIADSIPNEIHSIDSALSNAPLFGEYAKKYPQLIKYKEINGKYRAWATHAGGLIISRRELTGLIPVRKDKDGSMALEYDKERAEENGLVKMDMLGLSTLDIVDVAYKLIRLNGKTPPIKIDYNEYDQKTYDLISSGDTFCVFQLGTSAGTMDLCKRIKPQTIEDISHINALARPSARDMRENFIKTRDGDKKVSLIHNSLERAFGETYGFGLYEECLMYLAQDVAGWSLHEADRLRKLTKEKGKNPKKAQQWRQEFIEQASKKGVHEEIAKRIWDEVVEKFQGYGFNKSLSLFENVDIYTSDGKFLQSKPIGEVSPGEYVRSRDEKTGKDIFIPVKENHDHGVLRLVEVELETGEKVKCTLDHKFRTVETGEMLPLWQILKDNLSIVVGNHGQIA